MRMEYGEFGVAPDQMSQVSGINNLNIKLLVFFDQNNPEKRVERLGVVSRDFSQLFFMDDADPSEVNISDRISPEEAADILRSESDPAHCPPGPFRLQPGLEGRLLWVSGDPASGKSTSAQLLARQAGWVYYEVDCFRQLRNPFIPPDLPNPSIQQSRQRALAGEGRDERKALCDKIGPIWSKMVKLEEPSEEEWREMENYIRVLCEDINTQRRRIGGDWVVAGCFPPSRIRDVLRSALTIIDQY